MGGEARREAQVAEDNVLDPLAHVALADRARLDRLLAREAKHDRDVVRAERPQGVLVRPQLAQVQPVRVDVVDVAELARLGDLLQLLDARVVLEQVSDHQHPAGVARGVRNLLGLGRGLREGLLHEAVLARLEHACRQLGMARHVRGHDDRVEIGVGEQLVQFTGLAHTRKLSARARTCLLRGVAEPAELGVRQAVEVAREVGAPVPESDHPDPHRAANLALRGHRRSV